MGGEDKDEDDNDDDDDGGMHMAGHVVGSRDAHAVETTVRVDLATLQKASQALPHIWPRRCHPPHSSQSSSCIDLFLDLLASVTKCVPESIYMIKGIGRHARQAAQIVMVRVCQE